MPIQLLSTDVSSKIAAGEVIERPASAVKELIENSLDAGATRISVDVMGGGSESIRISDNGTGIPSDEVGLAFQRFATSKVSTTKDLASISTLGFRGEALPSIAAVSEVTMITRSSDEPTGMRYENTGIDTSTPKLAGAPIGTTITVRRLFGNFPARRKFLKTTGTENSRIQTSVIRYALAYPEVKFDLNCDNKKKFTSPGNGELRSVIGAVYGLKIAEQMLVLPATNENEISLDINGLLSQPSVNRANRSYISFFVNRRWVQNRFLVYALEQAYHGFMAERRFPIGVLNITMPFEDVDVNAHPTKAEVRFLRENQVFAALQRVVRQALLTDSPVPQIQNITPTQTQKSQIGSHTAGSFWPTKPFAHVSAADQTKLLEIAGWSETHDDFQHVGQSDEIVRSIPSDTLPILRVIGQIQSTYVVAEAPDGMYLIDQHAAHERVTFERVKSEAISKAASVQTLMEPVLLELSPDNKNSLEKHLDAVKALGFVVEFFGGDSFLLRGVPSLVGEANPSEALLDILDFINDGGGYESWEERAAYSIACHSSIRAGKVLTYQEMIELIRQLEECVQPNTCPHGRPTMIHLTTGRIEREFGRR